MSNQTNSIRKQNYEMSSLRLVQHAKVLIVEQDASSMNQVADYVRAIGFSATTAANIAEADEVISGMKGGFDAIIINWAYADDAALRWIKETSKGGVGGYTPIIAMIDANQVQSAMDAGIIYYLTKPVAQGLLHTVIDTVLQDAQRQNNISEAWRRQRASFDMIETCSFSLSTLEQAEDVACVIASFFPNPQRVLIGITELMTNAIEHGNLGIGYERKKQLLQEDRWQYEIQARLNLPENKTKNIQAIFQRTAKGCYVSIKDQGAGFDWRSHLRLSLSRAGEHHGRGIALANLISFDNLGYNEQGNQVTAFVAIKPDLNW